MENIAGQHSHQNEEKFCLNDQKNFTFPFDGTDKDIRIPTREQTFCRGIQI